MKRREYNFSPLYREGCLLPHIPFVLGGLPFPHQNCLPIISQQIFLKFFINLSFHVEIYQLNQITWSISSLPVAFQGGSTRHMDPGTSGRDESRSALMAQNRNLGNESLMPQLFGSVPALSGAASYLAEKTSYIASCFPQFTEQTTTGIQDEQELVSFASEQTGDSISRNNLRLSRRHVNGSGPEIVDVSSDAPQGPDDIGRGEADAPSENSGALVVSTSTGTSSSGITLFQGLIEKVQRTVRGSADDIGWLQRDPDMPPVKDGTERFTEILNSIRYGVHRLPKSMVYLLIPGLFSNHSPLYFTTTKTTFSKMGLTCHIAKIHSESSVEKNAKELKDYIEEIHWGSKKRVMLLGHSKGGIDAAAAVSMYWPDLKDKVAGLVLAQSPYGGSPIATDILRPGQLGDYLNVRKIMEILICKVIKGDLQALEDLTYERRKEFLKKHPFPKELPVVSCHTEAKISPAVLATLSHVAHAELGQTAKLPVMMPLGAAMAACAQLLLMRYGEKSDGLVTCRDAEVPGSVVVHPERKLDHAWMVYSSINDDLSEADASQVCEALLTLLMEEGQRKKDELGLKDE